MARGSRVAQAADLPVRAAAPVDYVRVCPAQGTGFFFIPGTETCLRIGGNVRFEARFDERLVRTALPARNQNDFSFFARSTLTVDARTATEFGTLRSFAQIFFNSTDSANTSHALDRAFIQFAGLTAGRYTSFFDFWGGGLLRGGLQSDAGVEGIAYTATFGSGFSATASIEGPRRADPLGIYGGRNLPAFVANVRVDQAWGAAMLAGAINQVRVNEATRLAGGGDRTGWAVNAGVNIRLPMLASGSQLWLNATYADGAVAYTNIAGARDFRRVPVAAFADAYLVGTSTRTTKAWLLSGAIRHFWTPQIYSHLQGSFGKVDVPANVPGVRDVDFWQVGKTLGWTPVSGLLVAGEVTYTEGRRQRLVGDGADFRRTDGRWAGTIRVQRDF